MDKKRIGIVGFGNLGKYLVHHILRSEDMELAFIWNRRKEKMQEIVEERFICDELEEFSKFSADLIVEVAHPFITKKYGPMFLNECDYMIGSPTALASQEIEFELYKAASSHGLYVPAGALWGGHDIAKLDHEGKLTDLKVTMKKHPSCFRLESPLKEQNELITSCSSAVTLFNGPVRELCLLAPNNVNTMASAAIAAPSLGFDRVKGCLVSDPRLCDWHIVEVEVTGPTVNGNVFSVSTIRKNPADPGVVTGSATYGAFLSSMKRAGGQGMGVHLC